MRVLLTADLHYTLQQFDWLQGVAADYDFVVLAGDLLDVASPVPKSGQLVTVLEHLRRLSGKTGLAVCSGNHDLTARNAAGEKYADWMTQVRELSIPCDGDRFDAEGMAVTICPWWDGPASQAAVGAQLAADAQDRQGLWVWIYHAPPAGSPTACVGSRTVGDEVLLAWIDEHRPSAVLCGHIHNASFLENGSWIDRVGNTLVLNAGRQIGPVPTSIVIDTDRNEATWLSMMGQQTQPLSL